MAEKDLLDCIIEGIRNKKGANIVGIDLRSIPDAPVEAMVLAQGNSPIQVVAIADEVDDYVRTQTHTHPLRVVGRDNGEWVALDYGTIFVHIMLPTAREYYNLEGLWQAGERKDYN